MKQRLFSIIVIMICSLQVDQLWAQSQQQKNDAAFRLVRNYINTENSDSIYEMTNDDFRMKISRPAFDGVFKNSVFPLGKMKDAQYLKISRDISDYKVSFNTFVMEMRVGIDREGKLFALEFQPFRGAMVRKNFEVASNNPMQTVLDRKIDSIARNYIMRLNTVGLSIGILKDGKMTYYGYGETVKGTGKIPGPNSIFEIGSVSKTFTATLLAYYANEQKLNPDFPITKYMPDSIAKNVNLQVVSLTMLSNHTSGLPRMPDNWSAGVTDTLNPLKDYKKKNLYAYLKTAKLEAIPGQTYAYSNLGSAILGTVLERVSGKSYEQMVRQVICEPLKMTNTAQHLTPEQKKLMVALYTDKGETAKAWDMDAFAGAGGLRSTASDLLAFAQGNMKNTDDKLAKAMKLTQKVTFDKKPALGMAWFKDQIENDVYFWHNGATGGCYSYLGFMPSKGTAVVVLSNSTLEVDPVGEEILSALDK